MHVRSTKIKIYICGTARVFINSTGKIKLSQSFYVCPFNGSKQEIKLLITSLMNPNMGLFSVFFFLFFFFNGYQFIRRECFHFWLRPVGLGLYRSCWEILIDTTSPPAPALMTWYLTWSPGIKKFNENTNIRHKFVDQQVAKGNAIFMFIYVSLEKSEVFSFSTFIFL